jgi:adenine-specific DNA-methyltransferase
LKEIRLDTPALRKARGAFFTPEGAQKWTPALLEPDALAAYRSLTEGGEFSRLLDWGETYLGAVTGHNDYFTLTKAMVDEFGLPPSELLRICPPGSKHMRGLTFSEGAWQDLAKQGKRCYLFSPDPSYPSDRARAYIKVGAETGVNQGYKYRNRRPWWSVPLVDPPDLFFAYTNHDQPRLTANEAGAQLLNPRFGIALRPYRQLLGRDLLPIASLNSLTLLDAELVACVYGGELPKHDPRETEMLVVPSLATVEGASEELQAIRPQLTPALRAGDPSRAADLVDWIILRRYLGIAEPMIEALRQARNHLFQRRISRSRGVRGHD